MSPTVPKERRVDGPANHGEEICHIVTEEDPDTALCGKDVTGWPWNPPWPYCVSAEREDDEWQASVHARFNGVRLSKSCEENAACGCRTR
jgi:hypothetical protein